MKRLTPSRIVTLWAICALAVGIPAADSFARQKKAPVAEAPPPPPPPPPPPAGPVGLPKRMLADAAAYSAYIERVTSTSPTAFTSGASVEDILKGDAADDPDALIRGAVAYAAAAALQNTTFVSQLRTAGNSPENRQLMVSYILRDPAYVYLFQGADAATGLAQEALGSAGLRLLTAGKSVKLAAYDVQHQAWSKDEVVDRPGRLAAVKALSVGPLPKDERRELELLQKIQTREETPGTVVPMPKPPYTTLIDRAVQLAAIAAIGEATDEAYDRISVLTGDESAAGCLHRAKLDLFQCLAVAKPNYEDMFCLGQHVMADTGYCLAKNAGVAMPVEAPPPAPPPAVKAKTRGHTRTG